MSAATQRLLYAHPLCCFCGREEKAVNLEHQPARIMFPDGHRPKGVGFPGMRRPQSANSTRRGARSLLGAGHWQAQISERPVRERLEQGDHRRLASLSLGAGADCPAALGAGEGSADQAPQRQRKETRRSGSRNATSPSLASAFCVIQRLARYGERFDAAPLKFGSCCAAQSVAHADYVCRDNR